MFKNVASQKLTVFAWDVTTGLPKTGDAGNITAYVSKDDGTVTALADTSATEQDATNAKGNYLFDLAQAETNADKLSFSGKSTTTNVVIVAVPAVVYTVPPNFTTTAIDSNGRVDVIKVAGTTQTARDIGASVLVGDKTGFSLTQSFPSNFSSMALTVSGAVTAGTVSDKTGYSLTQTFPSNFSSLVISGGGAVTAGTVSDKSGYSLSQGFPTNFSSLAITVGGAVTLAATQAFNNTGQTTAMPANATQWLGTAIGTPDVAGYPKVDVTSAAVSAVQSGLATGSAQTTAQTAITAIKAKTDNLPSDPASASTVATANALTAVATTATSIKTKVDLNLDAKVSSVSGGGGASASDIAAAIAATTVDITVVGPIVRQTVIDIEQGDDYSTDVARRWVFTKLDNEPWPDDLTGHTITFTATKADGNDDSGDATMVKAGVATTLTGSGQSVYVAPTVSDTDTLALGVGAKGYTWRLTATSGSNVKTLRTGVMTVR